MHMYNHAMHIMLECVTICKCTCAFMYGRVHVNVWIYTTNTCTHLGFYRAHFKNPSNATHVYVYVYAIVHVCISMQ